MPHVSRQKSDEKILNNLFAELVKILSPHNTKDASKILNDLLTYTEKIMLAKRLAAIMMIAEGHSMYEIAAKLHISTSTVKRLHSNKQNAEYFQLLSVLRKRREEKERFWEIVETVSRLGMPSMGKDRWKAVK